MKNRTSSSASPGQIFSTELTWNRILAPGPLKVAVIDDDPDYLESTRLKLRKLGFEKVYIFEVDKETNWLAELRKLASQINTFFVDKKMYLDGWEVSKIIRDENPRAHIVLNSAFLSTLDKKKADACVSPVNHLQDKKNKQHEQFEKETKWAKNSHRKTLIFYLMILLFITILFFFLTAFLVSSFPMWVFYIGLTISLALPALGIVFRWQAPLYFKMAPIFGAAISSAAILIKASNESTSMSIMLFLSLAAALLLSEAVLLFLRIGAKPRIERR